MNKTNLFLIRWLLPILCFSIAIAFYLKTYDSATIKITLTQIGGVILIALFLLRRIDLGFKISKEEFLFVLPVIVFFIWGNLSFFVFSHFRHWGPFDEWVRRVIYTGLFFVVFYEFRSIRAIKNLTSWILSAALIVCIYGWVQWLKIDPFAWKGAFGTRIFSTFGNPNFFGAWLLLPAGISFSLFFRNKNWFYLFLFLFISHNVYITYSKGSYLGLNAVIISLAILISLYFTHFDRKKVLKILGTGVAIIFIASLILIVIMIKKNVNTARFRIFTWMGAMEMWKKHPIRGTGIGSYKVIYPLYRPPEIFDIEGKHNTETDHAHNEYLEIAYDEGVIGFGIFLWFLVTMFYVVLKKLNEMMDIETSVLIERKHLILGWTAGIIGMLTQAIMSVHVRFVSSGHIMWIGYGIIGALCFGEKKENTEIKNSSLFFSFLKIFIVVISLYLIMFFRRFFIADINHNIAIAYSKAGRWQQALTNYKKVITFWPDFVMAHYFMGNVFNDRWDMRKRWDPLTDGKFKEPRTDAERALSKYSDVKKIAPNYVQTHYQVGTVYTKLKMWDKAIENFLKYLDIDPKFPLAYFKIGWCYVQKGMMEEAEEAYRMAVKQNLKFVQAYINLANILFIRKKFNEAEFYYKKAIELNPKDVNLYLNLAGFYERTKRKKELKEVCLKILELQPNNKKARELLKNL